LPYAEPNPAILWPTIYCHRKIYFVETHHRSEE